ncbi:hypothetical protein ZIOFF_048788 [Zingiber officinale]|uniref:Transposase-associated domain-containing protein n=1 Tax=Zingiber officinale TaxID=94328 RepID=A0A8J5FVQ2_ZINOF|nr:hypothetical protein ZIOFF_048788 [Zingiber officinale]
MAPSKEWMSFFNDRFNEKYKVGVEQFLNYAFKKTSEENSIRCPCAKCSNTDYGSREVVEMHLNVNGIMTNYTTWYHHGERFGESSSDDEESEGSDCDEILRDLYPNMDGFDRSGLEIGSSKNKNGEEPNDKAKTFYRLLKDSEQPTYPDGKPIVILEKPKFETMDEIVKTIQSTASLSHIEVVEKCVGPQRYSHVFGFGGGLKRKHFNCSQPVYIKDLEAKLHEKEEENNILKRHMDGIESRLAKNENENQSTSDEPAIYGEVDTMMRASLNKVMKHTTTELEAHRATIVDLTEATPEKKAPLTPTTTTTEVIPQLVTRAPSSARESRRSLVHRSNVSRLTSSWSRRPLLEF